MDNTYVADEILKAGATKNVLLLSSMAMLVDVQLHGTSTASIGVGGGGTIHSLICFNSCSSQAKKHMLPVLRLVGIMDMAARLRGLGGPLEVWAGKHRMR